MNWVIRFIPKHDGEFYMLGGTIYRWIGSGLGAQLESLELRSCPAGTERDLDFGDGSPRERIRIFNCRREGLLCRMSWSIGSVRDMDEHLERTKALKQRLSRI